MWLTGMVEVAPSRDGDLEPKKAGRPSDDTATHNTTEHNHPITIPVFVELVKAARTGFHGEAGSHSPSMGQDAAVAV